MVRPPDAPHWERSAVGWFLDLCPADYRGYPVLGRHPLALAHLAAAHVSAQLEATRTARSGARAVLGEALPPPALVEVLDTLDLEEARLLSAVRGIGLVTEALRGQRYVARL